MRTAASAASSDWPTTSGTGTRSGPFEMVTLIVMPRSTVLPGGHRLGHDLAGREVAEHGLGLGLHAEGELAHGGLRLLERRADEIGHLARSRPE